MGWRATKRVPGLGAVEDPGVATLKISANREKRLVFYPFDVAGVALPMPLANGNWKRQQQPQAVGPKTVNGFITDIERVTARTARLRKRLANFFLAEFRRNGLIKNRSGRFEVRLPHLQTNAADRIR